MLSKLPSVVTSLELFRYWALAVPTYAMVAIVLAVTFYISANFMATPPPTSLNSMFGNFDHFLGMVYIYDKNLYAPSAPCNSSVFK